MQSIEQIAARELHDEVLGYLERHFHRYDGSPDPYAGQTRPGRLTFDQSRRVLNTPEKRMLAFKSVSKFTEDSWLKSIGGL
jgi:hypothetical protein